MDKTKSQITPQNEFDSLYSDIWKDRWPSLKQALNEPVKKVCFVPRHNSGNINLDIAHEELNLFQHSEAGYELDFASAFPALALDVKPNQTILDMCSAPGGKALLIQHLMRGSGSLTVNDVSTNRMFRLKRVLDEFVSPEERPQVQVTNKDASKWCLKFPDTYDRILLDAPCSSERHLLHMSKEMAKWKPNKSKQVSKKQYALLASALQCLKPGGIVIYSTCSINPTENDEVIARLLKRKSDQCKSISLSFDLGEPTETGWQILPDKTGYGPIYLSKIVKQK